MPNAVENKQRQRELRKQGAGSPLRREVSVYKGDVYLRKMFPFPSLERQEEEDSELSALMD